MNRSPLTGFLAAVGLAFCLLALVPPTASQAAPIPTGDLTLAEQPVEPQSSSQPAAGPLAVAGPAQAPLNCRYGVGVLNNRTEWLSVLGAGWYLDFAVHVPVAGIASEYVQTVYILQSKTGCTYQPSYSTSPKLTDQEMGTLIAAHRGGALASRQRGRSRARPGQRLPESHPGRHVS